MFKIQSSAEEEMGQFDEMARRVKVASDAAAVEQRAAEASSRAADEKRFADDAALLEQQVLPLLHEAAKAFNDSGVPCSVYRNWDERSRHSHPSLLFKCEGRKTGLAKTGGSYVPTGIIVAVTGVGGDITVKTGKDRHDRFGSMSIRGEWRNALNLALEQALTSYHEHVAEHAHLS